MLWNKKELERAIKKLSNLVVYWFSVYSTFLHICGTHVKSLVSEFLDAFLIVNMELKALRSPESHTWFSVSSRVPLPRGSDPHNIRNHLYLHMVPLYWINLAKVSLENLSSLVRICHYLIKLLRDVLLKWISSPIESNKNWYKNTNGKNQCELFLLFLC